MAARSTRNKIRMHSKKAIECIDTILYHYKTIHELSDNQSKPINNNIRAVVDMLVMVQQRLEQFHLIL